MALRQASGDGPAVSIIIPSYNYGAFLPATLSSIAQQSSADWECIVVDDCSTDDTGRVLEDWTARDARFRYFRQPCNGGPSAARNAGLAVARGRYVQFLDADDRLEPRKLEAHAAVLEREPAVDIVYGAARFFRSEAPDRLMASLHGVLSEPFAEPVSGHGEAIVRRIVEHNLLPINAALVRREMFGRAGAFEESMRGCEDWDFFLRCAILGAHFEYCDAEGSRALIRSHPGSASRDQMRLMLGLVAGAARFPATAAGKAWPGPGLPAVYEAAAGIGEVLAGRRLAGFRRLRAAVRAADGPLLRLRWTAYACAGLLGPAWLFRWLIARPMPEWPVELLRRLGPRKGPAVGEVRS